MKIFVIAVLMFASKCAIAGSAGTDDRQLSVLDGLRPAVQIEGQAPLRWTLAERMAEWNTPGIAIAVIDDFRVEWVRTEGLVDVDAKGDVTPVTRFHAKSISKPVTAFATLLMAERFNLDIDTDISHFLQSWRVPQNEFTRGHAVTTAQILSHSAGFTRWGVDSYKSNEELPTLLQSIKGESPAKYSPLTIDYVPGTDSRYSGGGYGVLQQMLLDVSHVGFADLMRYLVLDPIDMQHSDFPQPMSREWGDVGASGHNASGEVIDGRWETLPMMAAGGLWTTAEDLALFVIEIMLAWNGQSDLMSQDTAKLMLTRVTDSRSLGFEVADDSGLLEFSHTGSGDGFHALIVGHPESGDGLVILSNGGAGSMLRSEIRRSVADVYRWANRAPDVSRRVMEMSEDEAARYVGIYKFEDGVVWKVAQIDGRLMIDEGYGSGWVEIHAESPGLFFSLANDDYEFRLTTSGTVDALIYTWGQTRYTARKTN